MVISFSMCICCLFTCFKNAFLKIVQKAVTEKQRQTIELLGQAKARNGD